MQWSRWVAEVANGVGRAIAWVVPLECLKERRFWRIALLPLVNLAVLAFVLFVILSDATTLLPRLGPYTEPITTTFPALGPYNAVTTSSSAWLMVFVGAMVLPLALLLRLLDNEGPTPFSLAFSPSACILSVAALVWAVLRCRQGVDVEAVVAASVSCLAGFFLFVPFRDCLHRLKDQRIAAIIAVLGCSCPLAYLSLATLIWRFTASGTTMMVRALIRLSGTKTWAAFVYTPGYHGTYHQGMSVILRSSDVVVTIFWPCSGVEGVFLLFYLLSAFLLVDWRFLSPRGYLVELYSFGVLYMPCINAMRIAFIFMYAEWMKAQGISKNADTTVEMFHSNIGWVIDSVAVVVFLLFLYRQAAVSGRSLRR